MARSQEVLLQLLNYYIHDAQSVGDFTDVDWEEVDALAVRQGVLPIAFDGFRKLYERWHVDAPAEVKLQWYGATKQAEKHYGEHLAAIKTLTDYLAEKNLRVMVLKGYSLSLCYPVSSHRPCGDIDIYCFGDYQKVDELVSQNANCKVDRSHHHHTVFQWNGITVENHYDFVNVYAHRSSAWLEKEFKKLAEEPCEKIGNVYIPSPNLHALFLIRHAGAHFAGENITLRHLLDWHFFCEKYGEKVDWKYVEDCAEKSGCKEFLDCMRTCVDRLVGKEYTNNEKAERMWNDILSPEFSEPKSSGGFAHALFIAKRWWANRWKHKMVYSECLAEQLWTLTLSHLIKPKV